MISEGETLLCERSIRWLPSIYAPTGNQIHSTGMCPAASPRMGQGSNELSPARALFPFDAVLIGCLFIGIYMPIYWHITVDIISYEPFPPWVICCNVSSFISDIWKLSISFFLRVAKVCWYCLCFQKINSYLFPIVFLCSIWFISTLSIFKFYFANFRLGLFFSRFLTYNVGLFVEILSHF